MKKILLTIAVIFALSSTQLSALSLVHYWNFNATNVPVDAASATDVVSTPLTPIHTDLSLTTTPATLIYQAIPGTASPYSTYWDVTTGDLGNARNSDVAGNCLRLRNPSDQMQLVLNIPSTGYRNITISYDIQRSSVGNGALTNTYYYSVDNGTTWKNSTTNSGLISRDTIQTSAAWAVKSVTITDPAANNNANLKFKILFTGGQNTGSSGNNRIDNVTVEGDILAAVNTPVANEVSMYPNPCKSGVVNFGEAVNVDVFNLVGKQLKTVSKTTTLSTSDLAKGIYTIRINGALTQKLIIE